MDRKYELFEDYETIKRSPGVYWKIQMYPEDGDTKEMYVANNLLKPEWFNGIRKEDDVVIDKNCLYFREVVELTLSSAGNVVDIASAVIIDPIKLA